MTTRIYLLRHAQSVPSPDVHEDDWPLSPKGHQDAERWATLLSSLDITHIYSSPYPRAHDTVAPFAHMAGLPIHVRAELREKRLVDGWVEDFMSLVRRAWSDLSLAFQPGGESSLACQARMVAMVEEVLQKHAGEGVVLSSHGNAIGLMLRALDPSFGFEQWRALRNPDLFELRGPTLNTLEVRRVEP